MLYKYPDESENTITRAIHCAADILRDRVEQDLLNMAKRPFNFEPVRVSTMKSSVSAPGLGGLVVSHEQSALAASVGNGLVPVV